MIDVKALKNQMGEEAMRIMAAGIPIDHWNERKREGLCPFHNEKTRADTGHHRLLHDL